MCRSYSDERFGSYRSSLCTSFALICPVALLLIHKVYRPSAFSVFLGLLLLLLNSTSYTAPYILLTFPRINVYSVNKIYLGCSCNCISGIFQTIFIARHIHNSYEKILWPICLLTGRTSLSVLLNSASASMCFVLWTNRNC